MRSLGERRSALRRHRRVSPAGGTRRFLLGCAGANQKILAMCPTETEKYVGLGSAVLISSTLAAASGTVALATAAGGGRDLGTWLLACLPLGAVYGTVVFAIDRFLVSSSLNPVTQLDASAADGTAVRALRRAGEVVRTLVAAGPRLVLAALIGLLVAEPVLLVVFRHEVGQRVAQMQAAMLDEAEQQVDAGYDEELQRIAAREAELTERDPAVAAAAGELSAIDDGIEAASTELARLQVLLRNEIAGVAVGEAADRTTGRAGDGPVADELRAEIEIQQARLDGLTVRRQAQQGRVDELGAGQQDRSDSASTELASLAEQRLALADARQVELAEVASRTAGADGLLVRIEALEWLTRNQLVPTDAGGAPAAGGGLTTIGLAVWLVRLWVLVLDAIPVGFKVLLSLRSRRPYEAMLAAHQAAEIDLARAMFNGRSRSSRDRPAGVDGADAAGARGEADGHSRSDPLARELVTASPARNGRRGRTSGARYLSPSESLGRFSRSADVER